MAHEPTVRAPTNRPTAVILGILLIVLILVGTWVYLQRQGKARRNSTQGHTALIQHSASA